MKMQTIFRVLLWIALFWVSVVPVGAVMDSAALKALYEQVHEADLDETRVVEVKNITLQHHGATFYLQTGTLSFLKPVTVDGQEVTTGALFIGEGAFSFVPPTAIERGQLARFHKSERLDYMFEILYLRFTGDDIMAALQNGAVNQVEMSRTLGDEKAYCDKYFQEARNEDVAFYMMQDL